MTAVHAITIADVGGGALDWWCACRIAAGEDAFTLDDAVHSAARAHERQEGEPFTVVSEPQLTDRGGWTAIVAPTAAGVR